ncbi:MAG: hypothetical protein JF616_13990 [Fibrobacteres bacterium]|jgi:hypothetical protein|nr:hypothetical protein [Fibrobacterota bacterium]
MDTAITSPYDPRCLMKAFRAALSLLTLLGIACLPARAASIEGPKGDAGEAPVAPRPRLPMDSIRAPEIRSVPYPNGAIYLAHGITGSFMGGKRGLSRDQNFLFQWQGDLSYFYTPWFSGGMAFRIIAGEPNSDRQKIINRYYAQGRFHKSWENAAVYVGPQIGVGNINILTDSIAKQKDLEPIKNTKPTLALDFGGGWKFSRYVGLTFGSNLEYSLVDEDRSGVTNSLNMHIIPGLALDVLPLTPRLRKLVPAFYVFAESQMGFLLSAATGSRRELALVGGLGLAF